MFEVNLNIHRASPDKWVAQKVREATANIQEPAKLKVALDKINKGRRPQPEINTYEALYTALKQNPNERYFYEHAGQPIAKYDSDDEGEQSDCEPGYDNQFSQWCIPFYDFDATVAEELNSTDVDEITMTILSGLREVHGDAAEFKIARACGYSPEKQKYKFSMHVYVHGVGKYECPLSFKGHKVRAASIAVTQALDKAGYSFLGSKVMDEGIYRNTNSSLRTIYSFKRGEKHRPMMPLNEEGEEIPIENITIEEFAEFFFTTNIFGKEKIVEWGYVPADSREGRTVEAADSELVKHTLATLGDKYPEIAAAFTIRTVSEIGNGADRCTQIMFDRSTAGALMCPICKRAHDSDNFMYLTVNSERIAMKCLREEVKAGDQRTAIVVGDSLTAIAVAEEMSLFSGEDPEDVIARNVAASAKRAEKSRVLRADNVSTDDDISFYAEDKNAEDIIAANARADSAAIAGEAEDAPIVIDSAETKALTDVLTELQNQRTALEDELKHMGTDLKTAKELKQRERLVTKIAKLAEKESKQREKIATKIAKLTEKEQKARDKRAKEAMKLQLKTAQAAKANWQPGDDAPQEIREIWHATRYAMGDQGLADLYRKYYGGDLVMGDVETVFLFNRELKIWQNYNVKSCITSCHLRDIIVPIVEKCQAYDAYTEYMQATYDDTLNKLRKTKQAAAIFSQTMSHFIDPQFETRDYDNHHLFPIADGKVINFKTGQIEERQREHMLIYTSNVRYISKDDETYTEGMAAVNSFIKNVTGEFSGCTLPGDRSTLTRFMQDMLGYLLTGGVAPKLYFIWNGEKGNNGKSILDNVMSKILDGYHRTATKRAFIAKKQTAAHDADLTPLLTGRMIVMNELNKNQEFDQDTIKQWSGFDGVAARECNQAGKDALVIKPRGKIVMKTNTIPEWKQTGSDDVDFRAFVNRMCVIPFDVEFVDEIKNPGCQRLKDKQLVQDIEGKYLSHFFTWVCEGAMRYYAKHESIDIPEIVRNKKEAVIRSKDVFRDFLDETIEIINDDSKKVFVSELWARYRAFMQGSQAMSSIAFGKQMMALFASKHVHTNQGNAYKGMKLKFEDPAPASVERPVMMELV